MNILPKLAAVALFGLAGAACSNDGGAPARVAAAPVVSSPTAPAGSAIPMQGLLVENPGTEAGSAPKLAWLGKPDAAVQAFLNGQAARD